MHCLSFLTLPPEFPSPFFPFSPPPLPYLFRPVGPRQLRPGSVPRFRVVPAIVLVEIVIAALIVVRLCYIQFDNRRKRRRHFVVWRHWSHHARREHKRREKRDKH